MWLWAPASKILRCYIIQNTNEVEAAHVPPVDDESAHNDNEVEVVRCFKLLLTATY